MLTKFILILFFLLSKFGISQTYFSIVDTTSVWRSEFGIGHDGAIDELDLVLSSIGNDTFFNGYQYYELIELYQEIDCCWMPHPAFTYPDPHYLRDDSLGHVFISNTFSEDLLYDFNLEAGESLPLSAINDDPQNFVFSVDSILIGSDYRKRFNIANHDDWEDEPYASIIEGIGSTNGLRVYLLPPFESYNQLICFTNGGNTIQFADQYPGISEIDDNNLACDFIFVEIFNVNVNVNQISIFPNPATDFIHIQSNFSKNLSGILIISNSMNEVMIKHHIELSNNPIYIENISKLPSGIYYLQFFVDDLFQSIKLIII